MKWYKESESTAVIKFYGDIHYWWNSAEDFTNTFDQLQKEFAEIKIRVHCYGGMVFEGNVIQHAIATSKVPVHIIIEGVAASMGSLFILPAKKISMAENGFMMIHEPRSYAEGNSKQFFETANLLKKMTKNAVNDYAKRSGKPTSKFDGMMDGADHWLTAEEAKELGLIDEIIPSVVTDMTDISKADLGTEDKFKAVFDRYTASLGDKASIPNSNHKTSTMELKLLIIQLLGLTDLTKDSSDTAVANAVKEKFTKQETAMAALRKSQIDGAIASAETASGRTFTEDEKKNFTTIGEKACIDTLLTALALTKPATPAAQQTTTTTPAAPMIVNMITQEKVDQPGAEDAAKANWKYADWQKNDNTGLMNMREENKDRYIALYTAEFGFAPEF